MFGPSGKSKEVAQLIWDGRNKAVGTKKLQHMNPKWSENFKSKQVQALLEEATLDFSISSALISSALIVFLHSVVCSCFPVPCWSGCSLSLSHDRFIATADSECSVMGGDSSLRVEWYLGPSFGSQLQQPFLPTLLKFERQWPILAGVSCHAGGGDR